MQNSPGWRIAQGEWTCGNGQGVPQSYAVADGECACRDRKGGGNEARKEAGLIW